MNKARQTTVVDHRGTVIRFEIYTHPDSPVFEAPVKDYTSGANILKKFKQWAGEHGGAVLDS